MNYNSKIEIGMILWELATAGSPYDSLQIESFDQLIDEICVKGTREKIPDSLPSSLQKLIAACWQRVPDTRPTVLQVFPFRNIIFIF